MCDNYLKQLLILGHQFPFLQNEILQKIVGDRKVVIRDMIAGDRYVDYSKKPLNLLGYQLVRLEVAVVTV